MASSQVHTRELHKNQVTLYIATHNQTGLKYFGKTIRFFTEIDLQNYYHGSGIYWNYHLNKHGDDVTMIMYGIYSLLEVKEIALKFSEENNIVESDIWANLVEENGIDGNSTKGFLAVKDTRDNSTLQVSIEDFHKYDYYISSTKGIVTVLDSETKEYTQITKEEYKLDTLGRFKLHSEGFVNCVDVLTGITKKVTKEEFNKNDNLQNPMKGKLPVIDTRTNTKANVTQEEYKQFDYYVSPTSIAPVAVRDLSTNETTLVTDEEYLKNDNLIAAGAKLKIIVFDSNDVEMGYYIGVKSFGLSDEYKDLKRKSLINSARKKMKLFSKSKNHKYHNWYAIREELIF